MIRLAIVLFSCTLGLMTENIWYVIVGSVIYIIGEIIYIGWAEE